MIQSNFQDDARDCRDVKPNLTLKAFETGAVGDFAYPMTGETTSRSWHKTRWWARIVSSAEALKVRIGLKVAGLRPLTWAVRDWL